MASEVIKLNLIPKGEMPVFHASQFDTGRLITCELYRGEDTYSVPEGYTVELHCRKVDNNIVTMASTLINDNVVTFTSTEQLTACNGNNLCEVAILDEGYRIGTLNFILEVEVDPLKGGINSTTEIHNLENQIEDITTEIIGENYYNKTEVDDLLSAKADSDSVYTIGEVNTLLSGKANASDVYTKSQTDTLLNAKADVSDLPDMTDYYTKTATDALLDDKANAADVYTKTQTDTALATKADKSDTYTKEQVNVLIDNIFPTFTASGAIASFITALTKPLVSVITAEGATTITRCGMNLFNVDTATLRFFEYNNNIFSNTDIDTRPYVNFQIQSLLGTTIVALLVNTNVNVGLCKFDFTTSGVFDSLLIKVNGITKDFRIQIPFTKQGTFTISFNALSADPTVVGGVSFKDVQIETGNTASEYHAYNGQTVPVSEATTLETLSGVNNVFADVGDVTVQYKYMSI